MKAKRIFQFVIAFVFALCCATTAQVAPGRPGFVPTDSHEIDTVDLLNNAVLLTVPVRPKAGIVPFQANLTANSYVQAPEGGWSMPPMANVPDELPAFTISVNGTVGYWTTIGWTSSSASTCNGSATTKYSNWVITTADGTQHWLPPSDYTTSTSGGTCIPTLTDEATDGSGFIGKLSGPVGQVISANGYQYDIHAGLTDANGNKVYWYNCGSGTGFFFCDSLGVPSLNGTGGDNTGWWMNFEGVLPAYSWNDVNGNSQAVTPTTTNYPVRTAFHCTSPAITDQTSGSSYFTTKIALADSRNILFSYEQTPGYPTGDTTGRINKITLPEGGTVAYTYSDSTGHNGIDCTNQTVPILTRTLGNGDKTTYTLTYPSAGGNWIQAVNTVLDPGHNQTIYTFTPFLPGTSQNANAQLIAERQRYQGSSTPLETDLYSYNAGFTSTPSASLISQMPVTLPIGSLIVYHQPTGMSVWSAEETFFDAYGNVTYKAYFDYGASSPTRTTTVTYGSCTASCASISPTISNTAMAANYIFNRPGSIVVAQNGVNVAQANFTYDAKGNLTSRQVQTGSSSFIGQTTSNSYNPNGTPSAVFDLANNETDFAYSTGGYSDGCGSSFNPVFPTKTTNVGTGLYTQETYDCEGAVILSETDANGNATNYSYTNGSTGDPYWRVASASNPYRKVAYKTYPTSGLPNTSGGTFTFGSSIVGSLTTTDGYGRIIDAQRYQSPTGSDYDTVSTSFGWNGNYAQVQRSEPCSTTSGAACSSYAHTSEFDALGRLFTESTTNNETVTITYPVGTSATYMLSGLGPAPSGEHSKATQIGYDGLGRVINACSVGSTVSTGSGTACPLGVYNGALDTYTYTQSGTPYLHTEMDVTRAGQTRSFVYDPMGRVVTKATPEGGSVYNNYDTASGTCSASVGNLTASSDANGNAFCYYYDALNRVTKVTANNTTCRHFYYDTSYGTVPGGVSTPTNTLGRLAEASTDNCSGTLITDEWFSYDKVGRLTDYWQSTPHSTQYYHSTATFFDNGAVNTLQLASPSLYTMTFGLEGEGRVSSAEAGTNQMIYSTSFNPGAGGYGTGPNTVKLVGSSSDYDTYSYDQHTGRMTGYSFNVGSTVKTLTGALNWNADGTLESLATTDGFNAGGSLTCKTDPTGLTGYDDWNRLLTFDCGSGNWGQLFTYDQYGNLTKAQESGHTGTSWAPGYSSTTNQFTGGTFDADGNTTSDGSGSNYWGWNEFSKMAWYRQSSGAPTCGTNGKCATYDAFGRMVEQSDGSAWKEYWYTQAGQVQMSGTTANFASWPVSAAGTVIVSGNRGVVAYAHNDWLGNARVVSSFGRSVLADKAYTPYGEIFAKFGSSNSQYDVFAGIAGNFNNGVQWDAVARELAVFSRWLSPDPAGQGWNQYAYESNPNSVNDPLGLGGGACLAKGPVGVHPNTSGSCYPEPFGGDGGGGQGAGGQDDTGLYFGSTACQCSNLIQDVEGDYYQTYYTESFFGGGGAAAAGGDLVASVSVSWTNSINGQIVAEGSTQSWVSDLLNSFQPVMPVWGPNSLAKAGCTGPGIPCTVSRLSHAPPPDFPWATSYEYTVWDVNNNVVSGVTSVTEYWAMTMGSTPNQGLGDTWNADGGPLAYGNVVNGSFVDTYGSANGYVGIQSYTGVVGGVPFVISTTNNVISPAGGGYVWILSNP